MAHYLPSRHEYLRGSGNTTSALVNAFRPEKLNDCAQILDQCHEPLIAYGNGLSTGDVALPESACIHTSLYDYIYSFDAEKGLLTVESGCTLATILSIIVPKGWCLPVMPMTDRATIGGAVASNIHGNNQFISGDIGEWLMCMTIRLADKTLVTCSPTEHADIFWATIGGYGMTGIIENLVMRCKPISSSTLLRDRIMVSSVEGMVERMRERAGKVDFMLGWLDHLAPSQAFGRGMVELARHPKELHEVKPLVYDLKQTHAIILKSRMHLPYFRTILSGYRSFRNKWSSEERIAQELSLKEYFRSWDRLHYRGMLYGKSGSYDYQCMLPDTPDVAYQILDICERFNQARIPSYCTQIRFHRAGKGLMGFSQPGFSLALELPAGQATRELLNACDALIIEWGGKVYLGRDSRLSKKHFDMMYQDSFSVWQRILKEVDPHKRFISMMATRLKWKSW